MGKKDCSLYVCYLSKTLIEGDDVMSKVTGIDALNALKSGGDDNSNNEFSKFSSGTTYVVKILGTVDLMQFDSYGIYKVLNSFVAKNPSKKSANGYPVENLTPFDLAWKYFKDQSKEWTDTFAQESGKYRPRQRFAMGFFDLDSGEQIVIDVSKKQAQALHAAITKNEKRLDTFAFELAKEGSGTDTTVSLMPMLDDLTNEQQKNFDEAPEEFDSSKFDGILYEMNEEEQVEKLDELGFDVSLIGLEKPSGGNKESQGVGSGENGEILDDDLPF